MTRFRLLYALLAVVLALALLAGCAGREENPEPTPEGEGMMDGTEGEETDGLIDFDEPFDDGPLYRIQHESTIEETVVFDDRDIKITALELVYGQFGPSLSLLYENKSGKDLDFTPTRDDHCCLAVNKYAIDNVYGVLVPAGGKVTEAMPLDSYDWHLLGITEIAEVELGFYVFSRDDYNDYFLVDPVVLKTSSAGSHSHPEDAFRKTITSEPFQTEFDYRVDLHMEEALYDRGGLSILSQTLITNEREGRRLLYLEIENQSTESVRVSLSGLSINSVEMSESTFSRVTMNPGWRRVLIVDLSNRIDQAKMDVFGIKEIGEIGFSVSLHNAQGEEEVPLEKLAIVIPGADTGTDSLDEEVYEDKGIRIVHKGLILKDPSVERDDVFLLLLFENNSSTDIFVMDADVTAVVNGQETKYIPSPKTILEGESAIIELRIFGSSLKENGIETIDGIKEIEMGYKIVDDRVFSLTPLAEPRFKISY